MSVSLGSQLKAKRQALGLSIDHIAEQTRIAKSTLKALEVGDYDSLPARPFVRGFVRTYAKTLGLNPDESVQLFELEVGQPPKASSTQPPDLVVNAAPEDQDSVLWFQAPKFYFMAFGFVVTAILCIVIYFSLEKIQRYDVERSPKTETFGTPQAETPPGKTANKAESMVAAPSADNGASEKTPKTPEVNKASEAPKIETPTVSPSKKKDAAPKEAPLKSQPEKTAPPESHTVSVRAYEPVVLKIQWSSGASQSFDLKINEIKNVVFTQPVQLSINKGSAVRILFDDEPVAPGGLNDEPVDFNFP